MRITTTAPLPRLTEWSAAIFGHTADLDAIAAPWLLEGDRALWFSRAAWGLRAIVDGVAATRGGTPSVWLPDYFCNQPIQPLRQLGVPLVFYPIDENLDPDWARCEGLSKTQPPALFVLVHYFGVPVETTEARHFCDRSGAMLIEDAAHLMAPTGDVGHRADFVLYSQYKHLPVPNGGLLVMRPRAQDFAQQIAVAGRHIARTAPGTASWMAKRLLQALGPSLASALSNTQPNTFDDDPDTLPSLPDGALSVGSQRMIARLGRELRRLADRRRDNERCLRNLFGNAEDLEPFFPHIGSVAIPYRAVFQASSHADAQRWHARIRASGNVVESWPDLPPEVKAAANEHPVAITLRNTLLGLPIHADRRPADLEAAYGEAL